VQKFPFLFNTQFNQCGFDLKEPVVVVSQFVSTSESQMISFDPLKEPLWWFFIHYFVVKLHVYDAPLYQATPISTSEKKTRGN